MQKICKDEYLLVDDPSVLEMIRIVSQKQELGTDLSSSIIYLVYRNHGSRMVGKQERLNKMQILNSSAVWYLPQTTALMTNVLTPNDGNHSQTHGSVIWPKRVQIFCH